MLEDLGLVDRERGLAAGAREREREVEGARARLLVVLREVVVLLERLRLLAAELERALELADLPPAISLRFPY